MIDTTLLGGIALFLLYTFYDQFGMDYLKGKTRLKVRLKKRAKMDSLIFIALVGIIIYQTQAQIEAFTLYLLATAVALSLYMAFIRSPQLVFKAEGFFFENIFITYDKIQQVQLAEQSIFVIELKNGKRLIAPLQNAQDQEIVVALFGGYKTS